MSSSTSTGFSGFAGNMDTKTSVKEDAFGVSSGSQNNDGTQQQLHQAPFDNKVELGELSRKNRAKDTAAHIDFPVEMVYALNQAHAMHRPGARVPHVKHSLVSVGEHLNVYTCSENNTRVQPHSNVLGTTMELRLANELALDRFRSAVSKHFPDLMRGLGIIEKEDSWVNAKGDIRGLSRLAWWVDEAGCATLSAALPGTDYQVSIEVVSRPLVLSMPPLSK